MFEMCVKCGYMYEDNGNGCPNCNISMPQPEPVANVPVFDMPVIDFGEEERRRADEERLAIEAEAFRIAEEERLAREAEAFRLAEEERLAREAEVISITYSHILRREKTNECIFINKNGFVIGRSETRADYIIVDNPSISRVHSTLYIDGSHCYISDNNSLNKTFVNGRMLNENECI